MLHLVCRCRCQRNVGARALTGVASSCTQVHTCLFYFIFNSSFTLLFYFFSFLTFCFPPILPSCLSLYASFLSITGILIARPLHPNFQRCVAPAPAPTPRTCDIVWYLPPKLHKLTISQIM